MIPIESAKINCEMPRQGANPRRSRPTRFTPQTLLFNATLAPAVVLGVFAGKLLLGKINQQAFEWLLIAMALAGSLRLALA